MSAQIEIPASNFPRPRLFSVELYDSMIANGVLTENDNVELLNGQIIEKMPKGDRHAYCNDGISDFLKEKLGSAVVIRNQNPILLGDFSEPEPDLAVCLGPREKYRSQKPEPSNILLLIEISDTTVYFDRGEKGLAYARAGIQHYIIVNLTNDSVEDYREPADDGFQMKNTYRADESFDLVAFPGVRIRASELLPD